MSFDRKTGAGRQNMAEDNHFNETQRAAEGKRTGLVHWKIIAIFLMFYDIVAIFAAYYLALWMRFDFVRTDIPRRYMRAYVGFLPWYAAACVIVFWILKIYRSVWRYAGERELFRVGAASLVLSALHAVGITVFFRRMPMSYYFAGMLLQAVFLIGIRFSYRVVLYIRNGGKNAKKAAARVMLIGAGQAGQMLLRDLSTSTGP